MQSINNNKNNTKNDNKYIKKIKYIIKNNLKNIVFHNSKCNTCDKICFFSNKQENISTLNLPQTDRIIINLFNNDMGIDVIFKIIDDMTEYLNGELGLFSKDDFLILYDDNYTTVDRYSQFF